jgi:signal transduction histidine kinase
MGRPPRRLVLRLVTDTVLALVFGAVAVFELTHVVEETHQRAPLWVDVVLQLVLCSTLVLRRTRPTPALGAFLAIYLLPALVMSRAALFFGDLVPLLLLTYTVARYGPRLWSRWSWVSGVVFWAGLVLHAGRYVDQVRDPLLPVALPLGAWAVARVLRRLAEQQEELGEALGRLSREQQARELRAVGLERARIAAEMHDVVAHAVSLMIVQVGNARMGLERSGEPRDRLRAAESTGRQALTELRRSLGVMRSTGPGPLPDLSQLPGLVDGMRAAGLEVRLRIEDVEGVAPSVQLAAHRVVQEALTNALAHGAGSATASIGRSVGALVVSIDNPVPPGFVAGMAGHGILGMRERVHVFEGRFVAGRTRDGFEVRAEFPLAAVEALTC